MRQPADRGRVRPRIVIDDDDHLTIRTRDVVQGLPGHAPGETTITDNRHDMVRAQDAALFPGLGDPVGI